MNDQEAISPPKNRDKYLDMEEKMWRFAISIELQQNDESHERLRSAIHDFVSSFRASEKAQDDRIGKLGTSVVSRTDTTHKAASKKLALWQGHNSSSRFGGVSHYEWVFARPWDGVDPSITVGSEVTT